MVFGRVLPNMTQPSKAFWEPISIIALLLLILLISICHLQGWLKRGKSGEAQPVPEGTSSREKSSKPREQPSAEPTTPSATDAESEAGQPSAGSTPVPTPKSVAEGGKKTRVLTEEETVEHQPAYRQTMETADGAIQINLNGLGLGQVEMNDRRSDTAPPSPVSSEDSFHSFMPRRRGDNDSDSSNSDSGPSPGGNPPAQGRPPSPYPSAEGVQGECHFQTHSETLLSRCSQRSGHGATTTVRSAWQAYLSVLRRHSGRDIPASRTRRSIRPWRGTASSPYEFNRECSPCLPYLSRELIANRVSPPWPSWTVTMETLTQR